MTSPLAQDIVHRLTTWHLSLDSANKLVQIVVATIGGYAAYIKFGVKANVSITGKPFMSRGTRYLIITSVIDNVGTVRQTLEQRGTGVRISVLEDKGLGSGFPVSWSELTVLAVFEKQQWLEPSEKVTDVLVVKIPSDRAAIKVEIRVITKPKIGPRNLEWNATTVLELNESSWTDPGLETD